MSYGYILVNTIYTLIKLEKNEILEKRNFKKRHKIQACLKIILKFNRHKITLGASLVAQWLRICPTMQGTWVRALVREDPTCCGATKSVCHNY